VRRPIFRGGAIRTTAPGDIVQQPDLFRKVGKPSRVPMTPNADGLFTLDQVAVLASKRGCRTKLIDDYACAVT
jgi:hypothetical protein